MFTRLHNIHDARMPKKEAVKVFHIEQRLVNQYCNKSKKTDNIHLKDIVKQGIIYNSKFSSATSSKIDEANNRFFMLNKLEIKNPYYAEDINGSENRSDIVILANNL